MRQLPENRNLREGPGRRWSLALALAMSAGLVWFAGPAGWARPAAGSEAAVQPAEAGLARVDSLLRLQLAEPALAEAQDLWRTWQNHPVYGWQVEGRLGLAFLMGSQPLAALPHLENVIRQQPLTAAHHRNLGAALLQLNRRGRALSEYQTAVELEPLEPDLRREYGQLLLAFGDVARAATELHLAQELCGGCEDLDQPLASLYLRQGDYPRAVPLLRRLHERQPTDDLRRSLVAAMSRADDDSALIAFLGTVPPPQRSLDEWRLLVEGEGRVGGSAAARTAAGWLAPGTGGVPSPALADDARFWGHAALNLLASGELEAALLAIAQAVKLEPENVVHLNNQVVILTRLGREAEARIVWSRVQSLNRASTESMPPKEPR